MNHRKFDVLIIGAGPAGSFAAERLARIGASVALFDGRPRNEPKACGGGVTSKALKSWPYLLEATCRMVDEIDMYSPTGKRVRLKLREPFAIYSRRAFDSNLRERAKRAGAQIFAEHVREWSLSDQGWEVKGKSGREWRGGTIVAADGANSPIARCLAGKLSASEMEIAFGYRAPLPQGTTPTTVVAFLPGWAGYAWAFPRFDHVSFGIATSQDDFDHLPLDDLLWDFIINYYHRAGEGSIWSLPGSSRSPRAQEIEKQLRHTIKRYAARIPGLKPETLDQRLTAGHDWALLGDAAGFADPVTGEGIYYALRSAELFAEAFQKGDVPLYEKFWRADFGRELRRAATMRRRFYGTFWGAPFTERMVDLARAHKGIRQTLCELVAGDQAYLNLKQTLFRRALLGR